MSGELLEVVGREDTRSPVRGHPPRPWRPVLYLLPAMLLVGAVLVVPLAATVVVSLRGGLRNYASILGDGQVRHAIADSLGWLVLALVVCLAGLALVRPLRGARRVGALAAPIAVSGLVTGVAFRLLFEPEGTVSAMTGHRIIFLGPGWIWMVLALAFSWQWVGLAMVVFRAGVTGLPRSLIRMARAFGAGGPRRFVTVIVPALFPVAALVLMIVLVAAVRVFDLILLAAPGSVQDDVDVVALHWWRWRSDLGTGGSAALAVLPFLFVAAVALAVLWGLSREWPSRTETPVVREPTRTGRVAGIVAIAAWALPPAVLVIESFRTPRAAAGGGWWTGGFGLGSYREAFQSGELAHALLSTGTRSLVAALLLVVVAAPAAYALAWGDLPRRMTRILIAVSAVLAVVPPQTVIVALGQVFDRLHLFGAPTALTVVHVALGVPLAVLLLRAAFASIPPKVVRARQIDPEPGSALFAVVARSLPAVVTVAVLEFVLVWNDLVVGLLLGGPESGQVTLVLMEQARQFATSTGVLAAGAVVATVLPLGLVLATGKWLVRGLTEGVRR
ncbi:MAG: alpha-glucoside transport system permease protein aglG, ggtD [Streptosporangiaceae bacterium]|nr:alpha-glucoside transport system permease protein aglG, ggtD [Streptosporangiaceae bacterium]